MEKEENKELQKEKINKRAICIAVICIIFIIIFASIVYGMIKMKKNEQEKITHDSLTQTEMEYIKYHTGTFHTKGIVVRVQDDMFTIMPIIANEEYSNEENFYMENNQIKNLKQGQEVLVTFSYPRFMQGDDKPIVEEVEILKEKSDIEIPRDVLVKAYSTKEKVAITVDEQNSNSKQLVFTITDSNELKYDYSTMEHKLYQYNSPPVKQEPINAEEGTYTLSYNAWPEVEKVLGASNRENYTLDKNGQINIKIDWTKTYGKLKEGKYRFTLSTVHSLRQSMTNPNVQEYPYDSITIEINFTIDHNGKLNYEESNDIEKIYNQ